MSASAASGGHEGKILLLIDGQPMNELLYSTIQLGNHYPIDAIQRIEVIRGPGSAIYGGYAELAVINIVMRDASDLKGVSVSGRYGQLGHTVGDANVTLSAGEVIDGVSLTAHLSLGRGTRSTGTYHDFAGLSYSMDGSSALDPTFADVGLAYDKLKLRFLADSYTVDTRDGVGEVLAQTAKQGFVSYYADAHYDVQLADHLTLTPRLSFIRQTPWEVTDKSSDLFYSKTATRYTAGLQLSYDVVKNVNLLVGTEAYVDHAHVNDQDLVGFQTLFGSSADVNYENVAAYAQLLANHDIANLTLGVRFEEHSDFGDSVVPRIALTKVMGRFHAKLLASQAFRAPGIENINLSGGGLQPEKTTVFEGELGAQLSDSRVRVGQRVRHHDQEADHLRLRSADRDGAVPQLRSDRHARRRGGLPAQVPARLCRRELLVLHRRRQEPRVGLRRARSRRRPARVPQHKLAMAGSLQLYRGLSLNPSAVIYGQRFGYTWADASGTPMIGREGPTALVNANLLYRNAFVRGLELAAGVFDIANQRPDYLQPYNGGHPPLPGPGRELVFRVAYEHPL